MSLKSSACSAFQIAFSSLSLSTRSRGVSLRLFVNAAGLASINPSRAAQLKKLDNAARNLFAVTAPLSRSMRFSSVAIIARLILPSSRERAQRARAEAETAKAEAAKAKAEAAKARAEAARARSENARARADARRAEQDAFANFFSGRRERKILHSGPRELLIKALGMLGSEHDGEILSAAHAAEAQRRKLGMTWEELLISADETEARKAA
jgi:multidrug resistance efflux pump